MDNHRKGVYVSAVSGVPLFRSDAKFDSGTGWPSFKAPFDPEHVREIRDVSHGMVRVEVVDAKSGAHLGHVFRGEARGHDRFCINSASLKFVPDEEVKEKLAATAAAPAEAAGAGGEKAAE